MGYMEQNDHGVHLCCNRFSCNCLLKIVVNLLHPVLKSIQNITECMTHDDCTLYYMDSTTEIDILSVTGADKCPYRKYEQLRLHSLEYQVTSARERWQENQDIKGSEREIGDNVVNVANCLLDCIM